MALNNVYNYIRKYIDRDFSKRLNVYANYECDDMIEECVMMIDYYDHDCPALFTILKSTILSYSMILMLRYVMRTLLNLIFLRQRLIEY